MYYPNSLLFIHVLVFLVIRILPRKPGVQHFVYLCRPFYDLTQLAAQLQDLLLFETLRLFLCFSLQPGQKLFLLITA